MLSFSNFFYLCFSHDLQTFFLKHYKDDFVSTFPQLPLCSRTFVKGDHCLGYFIHICAKDGFLWKTTSKRKNATCLIAIKANRTEIFYPKLKLAPCPERNTTQCSHLHAQVWEQQAMHPQSLSLSFSASGEDLALTVLEQDNIRS